MHSYVCNTSSWGPSVKRNILWLSRYSKSKIEKFPIRKILFTTPPVFYFTRHAKFEDEQLRSSGSRDGIKKNRSIDHQIEQQ